MNSLDLGKGGSYSIKKMKAEMSRHDRIEHRGVVREVSGPTVRVEIVRTSACARCHAGAVCGASETGSAIITADREGLEVLLGDEVFVTMASSLGPQAMFWAYLFPLVIFVIVFFSFYGVTGREGLSCLLAAVALLPYYSMLWFFRDRFEKVFEARIRKV